MANGGREFWLSGWSMPMMLVVCVFGAWTACADGGTRVISIEDFRDRMGSAWIGQSAGVAYGAPTEFKWRGQIVPEESMPKWRPGLINGTFSQDDLYVEMTFIDVLDRMGIDVSTREAGIEFANSRYRPCGEGAQSEKIK